MRIPLPAALFPLTLAGCPLALCIAERTKVLTPLGDVAVESLNVGASVFSFDLASSELVPCLVTVIRRAERECVSLDIAGSKLVCTSDHPLYDPVAQCFADAGDWVLGKRTSLLFRGTDGQLSHEPVTAATVDAGVRRVFDLTVDSEHHNFFASGMLVHNKSICEEPDCVGPVFGTTDAQTDTDGTSDGSPTSTSDEETTSDASSSGSGSGSSGSGSGSSGSGSGSSGSGSGSSGAGSGSSGAGSSSSGSR